MGADPYAALSIPDFGLPVKTEAAPGGTGCGCGGCSSGCSCCAKSGGCGAGGGVGDPSCGGGCGCTQRPPAPLAQPPLNASETIWTTWPSGNLPSYTTPGSGDALDAVVALVAVVPQAALATLKVAEVIPTLAGASGRVDCVSRFPDGPDLLVQLRPPAAAPLDPRPVFTYNSALASQSSELGFGWSHSFRRKVDAGFFGGPSVIGGTGRSLAYATPDPVTGDLRPRRRMQNTLQKDAGGAWTETQADGTAFRYNSSGQFGVPQEPQRRSLEHDL